MWPSLYDEFEISHLRKYRMLGISEEEFIHTLLLHFGDEENLPEMPDDSTRRTMILLHLLEKYKFPKGNIFIRFFGSIINIFRKIFHLNIPLNNIQKNYFAFLVKFIFDRDLIILNSDLQKEFNNITKNQGKWNVIRDLKTGNILCAMVFNSSNQEYEQYVYIIDTQLITAEDFFKMGKIYDDEEYNNICNTSLTLVKK